MFDVGLHLSIPRRLAVRRSGAGMPLDLVHGARGTLDVAAAILQSTAAVDAWSRQDRPIVASRLGGAADGRLPRSVGRESEVI